MAGEDEVLILLHSHEQASRMGSVPLLETWEPALVLSSLTRKYLGQPSQHMTIVETLASESASPVHRVVCPLDVLLPEVAFFNSTLSTRAPEHSMSQACLGVQSLEMPSRETHGKYCNYRSCRGCEFSATSKLVPNKSLDRCFL